MQYRHTFLSIETGGQSNRRRFLEGTDILKAQVFTVHKSIWSPISDKVEAWVKEGWATWEEEKPDWFTDHWKASVPEDMKPTKGKGGADGEDKTAAGNEVEEALMVGGGEEKIGRGRSVLEFISGLKAVGPKVMPAGGEVKREFEFDEAEFMRGIGRMESMGM